MRSDPRKQRPTNDISQYMASQTQRFSIYSEKQLSFNLQRSEIVKYFQTETYCHLPKKQIPFISPFEKRYCKSETSFQRNNFFTNDKLNMTVKKRYWKLQGKGNILRYTMFQAQGLRYQTNRRKTFRVLLQTSPLHQKQARQQ